ncbi:hypothetical protein [Shewanella woodyi]|uniref:hypothetical protein n=1 Tax=Shewanella woodyi TaxID=60961 RepID=UPI0037483B36
MKSETILILIQKAIDAGARGSVELSDIHDDLEGLLKFEGKDVVILDFFDCWADAVNHDYMVYETRDPSEWIEAALELKDWYQKEDEELSARKLWRETLRKNA